MRRFLRGGGYHSRAAGSRGPLRQGSGQALHSADSGRDHTRRKTLSAAKQKKARLLGARRTGRTFLRGDTGKPKSSRSGDWVDGSAPAGADLATEGRGQPLLGSCFVAMMKRGRLASCKGRYPRGKAVVSICYKQLSLQNEKIG
jgi:hypothetical protein